MLSEGRETPSNASQPNRLAGEIHVFPVRVYYEDTDVAGVVYYANYLKFAERARTEMLRQIGFSHSEMMTRDALAFTVRRCEVEYIKPARFDELLEVHTSDIEVEAASLWLDQRVTRDGDDLALMRIRLACLGKSGRPARIPDPLRAALAHLCETMIENSPNEFIKPLVTAKVTTGE